MSSSVPTYDTDADPRMYGFDLQTGDLVPVNAFDGQWGFGDVPSSDGPTESSENRQNRQEQAVQQGEAHLQNLQAQANAAAGATQAAAAAMVPPAVARAASAEQAMFTPNARPVFGVKPAESLYQPPAAQPLYKMPGGTPIFQDTNVRPLYGFEQRAAEQAAAQSAAQPYANAMVQRTPVAAFGSPGVAAPVAGAPIRPVSPDLSGLILRTPPPAVPAPHRVPPYPAQGHRFPPQMFDGPEGTSPMRRGDPNVGAYAAAPKVPRDLTGGTYPYMGSGTYIRQDQPRFAGYAGIDLADLDIALGTAAAEPAAPAAPAPKIDYAKAKKSQYRDVAGSGGYVYRQFADGSIQILVTGNVKALPTGTIIKKEGKDAKRWNAITGEIGTWESYRQARLKAVGRGVGIAAGLATSVAGAIGRKKRRKGKKRRKAAAAAPAPVEAPLPEAEPPAEEEGGLPSWAIPVGIGAAVLLFVMMGKKDDNKATR